MGRHTRKRPGSNSGKRNLLDFLSKTLGGTVLTRETEVEETQFHSTFSIDKFLRSENAFVVTKLHSGDTKFQTELYPC